MIEREERDEAAGKISVEMIDVLLSWMQNEKRNLDGFIANPVGHVDYNPYLIIDTAQLKGRSEMLGNIAHGLELISRFKNGDTDVTKSLHDNAIDTIPVVIWERLYNWMQNRVTSMETFLRKASEGDTPVPTSDYQGLAGFDTEKYLAELQMYKDSVEGLGIVITFTKQNLGA
ncbi:hypothetical protein [Paenibacillus xylanexedens]|uniref:hypothetical protein n=1 Tax=Paenibacillus xylanexedens TaxID=528191 RepID=UPI000F53C547|nr:hypothetical protein [Paenibacillus xylanexedens]